MFRTPFATDATLFPFTSFENGPVILAAAVYSSKTGAQE